MACSTKSLKICALVWDVIYALFGLAIISIGIYILIKFEHFHTAAYICIGVGLAVALNANFGIIGASRESSRMSRTFVIILAILMVLQILTVVFFWCFQNSLLANVDKTFGNLWQNQQIPIKPGNASRIASLERWLQCCGNTGPSDYMQAPYSCFDKNDKKNLDGCRQKFLDFFTEQWATFNICAVVLIVVELICAYFAYVLANSILNRWRRSKYYPK